MLKSQLRTCVREDPSPALAMVVETALMSLLVRSLHTHFWSFQLSLSAAPARSKSLWSSSRVAFITRERVGVIIHQYCGSCSIIPYLDLDTAGSECTNKRMNKEQASPCMCAKTKQTKRCAFARDTEGKTQISCSLEPWQNSNRSFA